MRNIIFCARFAEENAYAGGIITILNQYVKHTADFIKWGRTTALFNFKPRHTYKNKKIDNCYYSVVQKRAVLKHLKDKSNTVFHIHTSREFLFLKDIFLSRAVSKKLHIPVVLTVHVGMASTVFNRIRPLQNFCIRTLNRYVAKTIFLTKQIQKEFEQMGLLPERGTVLNNFHDLVPLQAQDILPRTSALHLLFTGAIHRDKGIMELLKALIPLQNLDFHLDICGKVTDQSIAEEFNGLVSALEDRVSVHGYVSGKLKTALFERADVFILPSYHEGMPLVILEAMATGCAIISTKVGGTPELLNDDNAQWVDIGSVEQISNAILKFADSPADMKKMQCRNRQDSEQFSVGQHIQKLCRIYDSCVSG